MESRLPTQLHTRRVAQTNPTAQSRANSTATSQEVQTSLHRVLHESPHLRGCSAEHFCNQCTFTLFSKRNTVLRTDTTDIYAPKLHFPANGRSKESAIHFTVKPISPWSWCDPAASHTKLWVTLGRRYKIYCHEKYWSHVWLMSSLNSFCNWRSAVHLVRIWLHWFLIAF